MNYLNQIISNRYLELKTNGINSIVAFNSTNTKMILGMLALLISTQTYTQESEVRHDGIVFPILSSYPSNPVQGQVIYYTATNPDEYQFYDGTNWKSLDSTGGSGSATDMIMDLGNGDGRIKVINGTNDAILFDLNGKQRMLFTSDAGANAELDLDGDLNMIDGNGNISFWEGNTIKAELEYNGFNLSLKNSETNGDLNLETTGDDIFLNSADDILFRTGGTTRGFMNQDGDLGLGVTNPIARLHVVHNSTDSDPTLFLNETDADFARIRMSSNSNSEYWQQKAKSLTDPELRYTYRDNGIENTILFMDGDDQEVGINTNFPAATLHIDGLTGADPFRVRYNNSSTRLMVHDNGSVSVGSATRPDEDLLLEVTGAIRAVPRTSETCVNSADIGKIYFDISTDKLRVCVADNSLAPGAQIGFENLN